MCSAKSTKGLNNGIPVFTEERANLKKNQNVISPDYIYKTIHFDVPTYKTYCDNEFIIRRLEVFKKRKDSFHLV